MKVRARDSPAGPAPTTHTRPMFAMSFSRVSGAAETSAGGLKNCREPARHRNGPVTPCDPVLPAGRPPIPGRPGWRRPVLAVLQGKPPPMLLIRDVQKTDLPHLKRLAAVLNTVNLPNDEETLERLIDVSVRSFAGKLKDPFEREYLFVLEEPRTGAVIGTSMVIAQHGTYDAPHIYYEVSER